MSQVRPPEDGEARRRVPVDEDASVTTKVVLMELVRAERPLSVETLAERTLLSDGAVRSALATLADRGACSERPDDERRPERFVADLPADASR